MNPSPKRLGKLVGFGLKMEPLLSGTVVGAPVVFFYKPWVIFSQRKSLKKIDFFSHFLGPSKFFQDDFGKDFLYSAIREILTKIILKTLRWAHKVIDEARSDGKEWRSGW